MGGPGGGPDLTIPMSDAFNTIMGYVQMAMPVALAIFAILFGVSLAVKLLRNLTK